MGDIETFAKQEITIKNLDHLGLISRMCDEIGLVSTIDQSVRPVLRIKTKKTRSSSLKNSAKAMRSIVFVCGGFLDIRYEYSKIRNT